MNIQTFFIKNQKYIMIILLGLFLIKSVQSCSRNMTISKLNNEITYLSDSLTTMMDNETGQLILKLSKANDSIKELNFEVKLAKSLEYSANERAKAVLKTASSIKSNTTTRLVVENHSKTDSISKNN